MEINDERQDQEFNNEEIEDREQSSEELNEDKIDDSEEEIEIVEEVEDLPFAKAEVVRLMKQHLDRDKMIRERVKVEMNKFLGEVLENVCAQLNEYPYTTVEYEMLKESIYPYKNIKRINQEKERILMHLEAIKADCNALSMDVKRTLKLKEVDDEGEDDDFYEIPE
ncbi:hypothetical protein [Methanobacterium alkalithermotolerans]|uniref:hypothetical protein n=1 Tax=Methanobacterium alkalithermotolerans TaxID=2731220 RepID=UPI003743FFBB